MRVVLGGDGLVLAFVLFCNVFSLFDVLLLT